MANTTTKKLIRLVTPKGIAQYPWVFDADKKFIAEGQYHVQLNITKEDAKSLITKLTEILNEAHAEFQKAKGKKFTKTPFFEDLDDDTVQFKFKQNAVIKRKDGTLTDVKIPVFDSKGTPLSADCHLGSGSTIKVAFTYAPYLNAVTKSVGLSLRLSAVQVIKLVAYGANEGAKGFGFDTEEDGYVAPENEKTGEEENTAEDTFADDEDTDY